jgi:K+-sensing histidine kinase KdpD
MRLSLRARFSHELRTQLTSVIGYAEYLEASEDGSMMNFTARMIRESGVELAQVCDAYFALGSVSRGELMLSRSLFVFADLVEDVVIRSQGSVLTKGVGVFYECELDALTSSMHADLKVMRQGLEALVIGTAQLLDKWSTVHVRLGQDVQRGVWVLSLTFSDIAAKSAQISLYEAFWRNPNYKFDLQTGPGVVLAMGKEMLKMTGAEFEFDTCSQSDSSRLRIAWQPL